MTERSRSEAGQHLLSRHSEAAAALFRGLLESAPDAIVIVDWAGCMMLVNRQAEQIFGYRREDLLGLPVEFLIPERFRAAHVGHRAQYSTAPRTRPMGLGMALYGRRKDGGEFPVEISLSPLETADGFLVISVVRDITDREQVEERLRHTAAALTERAAQLRALHEAGLVVSSDLSLEAVLQRVVELARELVGARYGALGVFDDRGQIARFLTSGLSLEERARLGDLPKGRGLLGAVLAEGRPIRVDDIATDSRSVGFPAGHPAMTTFLGVPIIARGRTYGNLYLTDKEGPTRIAPFTVEDTDLVELFAAQAAIAIDNARLHAEVQGLAAAVERERIARELHDSLAQALGYARLRATAGRDALRAGDPAAVERALADIADIAGDAYADVREAILGLRSRVGADRDLPSALAGYLERYRLQAGLAVELELGDKVGEARFAPGVEAQLLRIVQEALANVRKHASARRAVLRLELGAGANGPRLRAIVADDGRGFDPERLPVGARFGLATMRERAEAAGGTLHVESAPSRGTRVIVGFPVETAPAPAATAGEEA